MAKQSFLVVSLKGGKAKKLAQALANETSLKILDLLANVDATETELANQLKIPISTIHYNLKILVESRMIKSDEFHYSDKGRVVNHYTLANKYILIAPENESGLKERLKLMLPVSVILLAAAGAIQVFSEPQFFRVFARNLGTNSVFEAGAVAIRTAGDEAAKTLMAAPVAAPQAALPINAAPGIALWFLIGSFTALGLYLLFRWLKERK